jgi:MFS family permease
MTRDRLKWLLSGATLALHLSVSTRYDFFRDELYFIACGRHPQFGYVDQPPLVPLLSALSQTLGEHLFLLRALSALAAAATVWVTIAMARLIGAGNFGAALAGTAAAIAPMYLGMTSTVGTSSFEPWLWTLLTYLIARALLKNEPHLFLWAGLVIGLDLETKYELPIYLLPLAVALLVTGHARALRRWQVLAGVALATVLAAPSAIWQLTHGLPFVEMLHSQAQGKNVVLSPGAFVLRQVMSMNAVFAPLWISGFAAPFVDARFSKMRFISVAFLLTFATMLALHAKDYFVSPLYGGAFAVGGAAFEAWVRQRWLRAGYVTAGVAFSAVAAPMSMPILPPARLVAYMRALHIGSKPTETLRQSAIPQTYADMVGWREYVERVTAAVHSLPAEEQARVIILARNYGEAGALEFYGRGLPPVVSGHNQYGLWGTRGHNPDVVIAINRDPDEVQENCREVLVLGRFGAPYVMPFEDDAPITLCRGLHPSLSELWPRIKFYY